MGRIIENLNLSEQVTNDLGRAIVAGEYSCESGLPTEAQLCTEYGISRTAVREAVKMLAAKGLISSRPRQGIRVEQPSNWNLYDTSVLKWLLDSSPSLLVLKDCLQMRRAIEPQAAALAAEYAKDEDIDQIEAAVNSMRLAAQDPKGSLHEADLAFHTSILFASRNSFFYQLRDFIRTPLNFIIPHTTPAKANDLAVVEDHAKICAAIRNRQPERARNLMTHLIDEAMAFIEAEINRRA